MDLKKINASGEKAVGEPEHYASLLVGAEPWAINQVREEIESLRADRARLRKALHTMEVRPLTHGDVAVSDPEYNKGYPLALPEDR